MHIRLPRILYLDYNLVIMICRSHLSSWTILMLNCQIRSKCDFIHIYIYITRSLTKKHIYGVIIYRGTLLPEQRVSIPERDT